MADNFREKLTRTKEQALYVNYNRVTMKRKSLTAATQLCIFQLCALLLVQADIGASPALATHPASAVATNIQPVARIGYPDDYRSFPGVAAQAAALDHDPLRLYQFVRDQIHFESWQRCSAPP